MAATTVGRPVVALLEIDRRWHRQAGRDVACALPLQPTLEDRATGVGIEPGVAAEAATGAADRLGNVTPADHRCFEPGLVFRAGVQEARTLRAAQPLVAVAGV